MKKAIALVLLLSLAGAGCSQKEQTPPSLVESDFSIISRAYNQGVSDAFEQINKSLLSSLEKKGEVSITTSDGEIILRPYVKEEENTTTPTE